MQYELTLSPEYVASWGFTEALREIMQNAIDAGGPVFSVVEEKDGTNTVSIYNANSYLARESLLMGISSKANDKNTIGQFGEGYKLALLVLARLGHKVRILNADEEWRPCLRKGKFNLMTLHVEVTKKVWRHKTNRIEWKIYGITKPQLADWDSKNIVDKKVPHIPIQGRRILVGPKYRGKIFVSGLFVCDSSLKFGYDLKPADIVLDRDRRAARDFDLQWCTSNLWSNHKKKKFVSYLALKGYDDVRYVSSFAGQNIVDSATALFIQKYGENTVPVQSENDVSALRARGYTGAYTIVEPTMYDIIKSAFANKLRGDALTPTDMIRNFATTFKDEFSVKCTAMLEELLESSKTWKF